MEWVPSQQYTLVDLYLASLSLSHELQILAQRPSMDAFAHHHNALKD